MATHSHHCKRGAWTMRPFGDLTVDNGFLNSHLISSWATRRARSSACTKSPASPSFSAEMHDVLFCSYDGHGGPQVAAHVRAILALQKLAKLPHALYTRPSLKCIEYTATTMQHSNYICMPHASFTSTLPRSSAPKSPCARPSLPRTSASTSTRATR